MIEFNSFSFVSDSRYRQILESDYAEISKCIDNDCYKSATTLSGSLIEALLTDYLLDKNIKKIPNVTSGGTVNVDNAGLHNIIEYCKSNNLITTRVYYLLEAIRDFRNLIHPTKAVRMEINVTKDDAILYKSTLDIILSEISKIRQNELGSTAEQLLHFMITDGHGVELFNHMVQKVKNEEEKKKYLISIVPKQILADLNETWKYYDQDGPNFNSPEEAEYVAMLDKRIKDVTESFHICFNKSNKDTKKIVANKLIEVLRNGTSIEKHFYIDLFEEEYLDLIDLIDKVFLVDYLYINSKSLSEILFSKILNKLAVELTKEKRTKLLENSIFMLKVRNKKELSESIAKFLKDVKLIDTNEYNEYISKISSLIINKPDSEIIEFNDIISDILTRLDESVPTYIPF